LSIAAGHPALLADGRQKAREQIVRVRDVLAGLDAVVVGALQVVAAEIHDARR
jgi:hypothetical protein